MGKRILSKEKSLSSIRDGVKLAVDTIGVTMGARGLGVTIVGGYGTLPEITKDGVTVSRNVMDNDEEKNVGVMFVRAACGKTVDEAGDGTTATAVLLGSMVEEGVKLISAGYNPQAMKRGMDLATQKVVEHIQSNSEKINHKKLLNIATISSNNDTEIGDLIAGAYKEIGLKGRLTMEMSSKPKSYVETVKGFEFPRGYKDEKFITDMNKAQAIYKNPKILVCNYDLNTIKPLHKSIEGFFNSGEPVIVIAKSISGELEGFMIVNKLKHGLKTVAIQAPSEYQREYLDDICAITGATLISDDNGLKLEGIKESHLGTCDSIIVGKESTTIIGGKGNKDIINDSYSLISAEIENESDDAFREVLKERQARLTASAGILYVGGKTDVEVREKYDRVEDAIKAVESAISEGVSIGGGVSLFNAKKVLTKIEASEEEMIGVNIIKKALEAPIAQILNNAGVQTQLILGELSKKTKNAGYDVKTNKHCDLKKSGILDPTKVIRVALQNATSVASNIITTNGMVLTTID